MRAVLCATAALALIAVGAPERAAPSVLIAENRCNTQTIDEASSHLRDYDRRASEGNSAQLLQRYGALVDVISVLNEERDVLESVCSSDAERAPLFAQIAAFSAWALALEADIAGKLNPSCSAAATALATMMLADAWLGLANVVNSDQGTVPAAFKDVVPKVRSRADAVGLNLPVWAETSAYWRDHVRIKAKAAIATCPSPAPVPSTSPRQP